MKFYFVKTGESLASIASLYGTDGQEILDLNDIANPDDIYQGQGILIPKSAKLCPFPQREKIVPKEDERRQVNKIPEPELPLRSESAPVLEQPTITLPEPIQLPTQSQIQSLTQRPTQVQTKRYEVQAGDNLFKIAQRFNTTVGTLVSLNNITDPDLLHLGQEIVVPDFTT